MKFIWCMVLEIWHACARQNFFSFWTIFCSFTPLTMQKIKILKKWKKRLEISSFHTSAPQITIISSIIPDIWSATGRIFCHFGLLFAPLPHWQPKKIKILKKWNKHLEISSFYTSVPKVMIICYSVSEIWHVTDVVIFHFGLFFAL